MVWKAPVRLVVRVEDQRDGVMLVWGVSMERDVEEVYHYYVLEELFKLAHAGVADEDVEAPPRIDDGLHELRACLGIAHVAGDGEQARGGGVLAAGYLGGFGGERSELRRRGVVGEMVHGYVCAVAQVAEDYGAPDSCHAAGDGHCFAREELWG
jgi:hypothetical protein